MLEFKNVSVSLSDGRSSSPFSLVVQPGEVVCISGVPGSGKSLLLKAVMGLAPLRTGFITVDGEPVDAGYGSFFRRMVSYVPQDLPEYEGTVADIMQSLGRLQVNAHRKADRKDVDVAWAQLQLPSTLYLQPWKSLTAEQCRLVLLSAAYIHERPILLVDDPVQNVDVDHFLQAMAAHGTEVVYTCAERSLGCQKVITLT